MKKALYILLFLSIKLIAQTGKVIGISDGDTITILTQENKPQKIRIADIDCPEIGQPFGKAAKQFTAQQIFGTTVQVIAKDPLNPFDKWNRIIGYVIYENQKNLSHELLQNGYAWHYSYYSNDSYMQELEMQAKKQKKGLWKNANPINPYQWRKGKRN